MSYIDIGDDSTDCFTVLQENYDAAGFDKQTIQPAETTNVISISCFDDDSNHSIFRSSPCFQVLLSDSENETGLYEPCTSTSETNEMEQEVVVEGPTVFEEQRINTSRIDQPSLTEKFSILSASLIAHTMDCCCGNRCVATVALDEILFAHTTYHGYDLNQRRQWLLAYLLSHGTDEYFAAGCQVCQQAFCIIYGIKPNSLKTAIHLYKKGHKFVDQKHCYDIGHRIPNKTLIALAHMEAIFNLLGEKQPHKFATHLPHTVDKKILFDRYKSSCIEEKIAYPTFCRLWKKYFPHVVIPAMNRFSKCDICVSLKEMLQKETNPENRSVIVSQINAHNQHQMSQRTAYYARRDIAKQQPHDYLSLIIDGMDQSKLSLPSVTNLRKGLKWQLRCHLTSVIVHGVKIFNYIDFQDLPHGANHTATLLLDVLSKLQHLPATLYIQADNCWRENKNQTVLALLAMLVQCDAFKRIELHFLIVGHTHEDIDQFFSRVAERLNKNDAWTMPDLINVINKTCDHGWKNYESATDLILAQHDVSSWLKPNLVPVHNQSHPRAFQFIKLDGEVTMRYKQNSTDVEWIGALKILKDTPQGIPLLKSPNCNEKVSLREVEKESMVIASNELFAMTPEQRSWWRSFPAFLTERFVSVPTYEWPSWLFSQSDQSFQINLPTINSLNPQLAQAIEDSLEPIPEVYVGPYRSSEQISHQLQVDHHCDEKSGEEPMEPGDLVAFKWNLEIEASCSINWTSGSDWEQYVPLIGKLTKLSESRIRMQVFDSGSFIGWNRSWRPWIQNGKSYEISIPLSSVVSYGFHFTNCNKLSRAMVQKLKKFYI